MRRSNLWMPKSFRTNPLQVQELEDRCTPATFTVNTSQDNVVSDAALTLREAIQAINTQSTAFFTASEKAQFSGTVGVSDTITFDSILGGDTFSLGSALSVSQSCRITVPVGTDTITLSGNNANRLFTIDNPSAVINVILDNLTLANGKATTAGAILNNSENLTLSTCIVQDNTATAGNGGAISSTGGTVTFTNCIVANNSASNNGGALDANAATVVITNSGLQDNTAGGQGGAIGAANGSLTLTQSRISGSTATGGGSIYSFTNTFTVDQSLVINNSTAGNGGGFRIVGGINTFTSSTFSGNKAAQGAVIYLTGNLNTSAIRNVTIAQNTASSFGGGILISNATGTLALQNSTITGNSAGDNGGGIASYKTSLVINAESCIIAGNTSPLGADFINNGNTFNIRNSAFEITTGGTFTNQGGNIIGPVANLKLGTLADSGGQNILFAADSPLINAGSNPSGVATDARGLIRSVGITDIGAVEMQSLVTNTNDFGSGSLREAVLDANRFPGPNSITFDDSFATAKTITLTSGEIAIGDALTITGRGASLTTLSGNKNSRIFRIGAAPALAPIAINALTFTAGRVTEDNGGGGAVRSVDQALSFTDCVLIGNAAVGSISAGGGAIQTRGGTLDLLRTSVLNNTSVDRGGGIRSIGTVCTIIDSTISGNSATGFISGGGGIAFYDTGTQTIRNSTISGNSAVSDGGGIALLFLNGTLNVENSTITANTGSGGGGISQSSGNPVINITSSIVSNNIGGTSADIAAGTVNVNFSAIGSSSGFTLAGGNNLIGQNLLLGPLQNNGGPTPTIQPALNSPVRDKGSNPAGLANDARGKGFPRHFGSAPDIGAVELPPNTPPTITGLGNLTTTAFTSISQFTIGDAETEVTALKLTATSSNLALVPLLGLEIGGIGANRGVTITSTGFGTATITVTVTDAGGLTAQASFLYTKTSLESEFSVANDQGKSSSVTLKNADNTPRFTLTPFGTSFTGGIRTASGDVTGDNVADLIVASGPGMAGTVRVFDGVTQKQIALPETVAGGGQPFGFTFTKGIIVATGDLNADGLSDLIITAEAGGGARVRIFQSTGNGFTQRSDFIALIGGDNVPDSKIFRGGSRATVSDINGDGIGDLIWAAGAGGGPRIATFNGALLNNGSNVSFKLSGDFFALASTLRDGCYLGGGDIDGDGIGDVVFGGGSGAPPQVVGYSGKNIVQNKFTRFLDFNFGTNSGQGIRVAVKDLNNDNIADVIVGSAPGAGSRVAAFNGNNLRGSTTGTALFDFTAFAGFSGGVFVG